MPVYPVVPTSITVHLGLPDSSAPNVTVPFTSYIKNVASHELYPTWPEAALREPWPISFALNRVYTEFYRSQGYDFDITSTTQRDQAYVSGGNVFENISQIVDDIFNNYIVRQGSVEPLFAASDGGVRTPVQRPEPMGQRIWRRPGTSPMRSCSTTTATTSTSCLTRRWPTTSPPIPAARWSGAPTARASAPSSSSSTASTRTTPASR